MKIDTFKIELTQLISRKMFRSKEIRWFSVKESKDIIQWFASQGNSFDTAGSRIDHYLPHLRNDGIGFKLREGNVELKHLTSKPEKARISPSAEGFMERYIKWSFNTAENDELSEKIIRENEYGWIEVKKERMGIKIRESEAGNRNWVDIAEEIPNGCQLEYTRIEINDKEAYYTFGLEWFGEPEIELEPAFIAEILGDTEFNFEESMGYAEFLNNLASD